MLVVSCFPLISHEDKYQSQGEVNLPISRVRDSILSSPIGQLAAACQGAAATEGVSGGVTMQPCVTLCWVYWAFWLFEQLTSQPLGCHCHTDIWDQCCTSPPGDLWLTCPFSFRSRVTDVNLGKLARGNAPECFVSPVARAAVELVEKSGLVAPPSGMVYSVHWGFCLFVCFSMRIRYWQIQSEARREMLFSAYCSLDNFWN